MTAHVILHATSASLLLLLELSLSLGMDLLGVVHALRVVHLELVLQLLVDELVLLRLELHLDWDPTTLEAWLRLLHVRLLLLLDELEERPQSILVLEEVLDGVLILSDER